MDRIDCGLIATCDFCRVAIAAAHSLRSRISCSQSQDLPRGKVSGPVLPGFWACKCPFEDWLLSCQQETPALQQKMSHAIEVAPRARSIRPHRGLSASRPPVSSSGGSGCPGRWLTQTSNSTLDLVASATDQAPRAATDAVDARRCSGRRMFRLFRAHIACRYERRSQ
jgi:hypothetical protein